MLRIALKCFITGVALACVTSVSSAAGELASDRAVPSGVYRHQLASGWRTDFSSLNSQIPNLSPTQKAWLKLEYDDEIAAAGNRFTSRAISATHSLEYQLRVAKPHLAELEKVLSILASDPPDDLDKQVELWVIIAHSFMDKGFWQSIEALRDRKLITEKIGHVDSFYYENYVLQAQTILMRIVIPHLQGDLPK